MRAKESHVEPSLSLAPVCSNKTEGSREVRGRIHNRRVNWGAMKFAWHRRCVNQESEVLRRFNSGHVREKQAEKLSDWGYSNPSGGFSSQINTGSK